PAGSNGLLLLPHFEGDRTPNVPDGTGVWGGVNNKTFEAGHFARAALEGVALAMNYGLRRLAELGVNPAQVRATRRRPKPHARRGRCERRAGISSGEADCLWPGARLPHARSSSTKPKASSGWVIPALVCAGARPAARTTTAATLWPRMRRATSRSPANSPPP